MCDAGIEQLKSEILAYLRNNPNGKDTAEGIARFWLVKRHVDVYVDDVRKSLAALVAEGVLSTADKEVQSENPDTVYWLSARGP